MAAPKLPTVFIDASTVNALLPFPALLSHLHSSLSSSLSIQSPLRHVHSLSSSHSSSLLLMPAWSSSYVGVKLVTSFPLNSPSVNASYHLFDALTGVVLAVLDGDELTLLRTAAVSALAARYLARPASRSLVLVGAGRLAPHLARAHLHARPGIRHVSIWNRTPAKARAVAAALREEPLFEGVELTVVEALTEEVVMAGDVISCSTGSHEALIMGRDLKPGAHLDLVGSFNAGMRECDDVAVTRGRVFVDTEAAVDEAGELLGAFERGVLTRNDVAGTLIDLVNGRVEGRRTEDEVTVFKSVGSAMVDLLAAQLVYENYLRGAR